MRMHHDPRPTAGYRRLMATGSSRAPLILFVAIALGSSGCGRLVESVLEPSPEEAAAPQETDEEKQKAFEAWLRPIGGQQLIDDVAWIERLDPKGSTGEHEVKTCMLMFLTAHKELEKGAKNRAKARFFDCHRQCTLSTNEHGGKYAAFTDRYIETCGAKEKRMAGDEHLVTAREFLDRFGRSETRLGRYYASFQVDRAIERAVEALGEDDAELAALRAEFDTMTAPHAKALGEMKQFMNRSDIQEIEAEKNRSTDTLNELRLKALEGSTPVLQSLIREREAALRSLQRRFDTELEAAGLAD